MDLKKRIKVIIYKIFPLGSIRRGQKWMKWAIKTFNHLIDILFLPVTIIAGILFYYFKRQSFQGLPVTKWAFLKIGMMPVVDHYYEPLFSKKHLRYSLRKDRILPGVDMNDEEQLRILDEFAYNDELVRFPVEKTNNRLEYSYNEGPFCSGDAEYLYNMIRHFKPRKIVEIGSGSSTLMAINAIKQNKTDEESYQCELICVEPFEKEWLEELGAEVIRQKVEMVDRSVFSSLQANDILFIDSSHIIRPQGDVLFEYLEILPILQKGVLVHIHDIFTPKDYLDEWVGNNFWNEQYLLEAFLTNNKEYRIIGAANYLSHKYTSRFAAKCPIFKIQNGREPGSFWIVKN